MAVERFEVGKTYRLTTADREVAPTLVGTPMGEAQYAEWMDRGRLRDGRLILAAWSEVPTYPERWVNVYPHGGAGVGPEDHGLTYHASREDADAAAKPRRIGVLHLHPDGTTTMEQP